MNKTVVAALVASSLLFSFAIASAQINIELEIQNKTTRETGKNVSASPGDLVRITARLFNESGQTLEGDVALVAGIPGCVIEDNFPFSLRKRQRRQAFVQDRIPAGHTGPLTVEVAVEANGFSDADSAVLTFGSSKPGARERVTLLGRIFLRMMTRGLANSLTSDGAATHEQIGFGELKQLFR